MSDENVSPEQLRVARDLEIVGQGLANTSPDVARAECEASSAGISDEYTPVGGSQAASFMGKIKEMEGQPIEFNPDSVPSADLT